MTASSLIERVQSFLAEPPPEHIFEITEHSLATSLTREPSRAQVELLPERGAIASPNTANVQLTDSYREILLRLAGSATGKRPGAALVIPDYAARMTVLDFQELPASEAEREALIRFRLRRSVPFHIDEATVSYAVQKVTTGRVEILAAAIARPILLEYEDIVRQAGYQVGAVIPSTLGALPLFAQNGSDVVLGAKLAGPVLTTVLLEGGLVRLIRCIQFGDSEEESSNQILLNVLQQTAAYAEDQIGKPVSQVALCGFGAGSEEFSVLIEGELGIPSRQVRSRFAPVSAEAAGLLGLLEQYAG